MADIKGFELFSVFFTQITWLFHFYLSIFET